MGRRRKRAKRGTTPAEPAQPQAAAPPPPRAPSAAPGTVALPGDLLAWRKRMQVLLDDVRAWGRLRYAEAVDAHLREYFGDPDAPEHAPDIASATDDFICSPGSAGDDASILAVYCDQAGLTASADPGDAGPNKEELSQVRRWDRERRRGVFILQRAQRDRLSLWDPLEGAPLTLHLMRKLSETKADTLARGTVVTAAYQPWMARLVAVSAEYFAEGQAVQLFREQTVEAGRSWHEAPAPAPEKTRSSLSKA